MQVSGAAPTFVVINPLITDKMQLTTTPATGAVAGQQYDLKATAALIKKRLTQLYPGVKFSVRSESFSMGNAIRVGWVDGPTEKPIQDFLDQFKSGSYNSMEDIYEYRRTQFTGKYISTSRSYSVAFVPQACHELDLSQVPSVEVQLRALGESLLNGRFYQPGRSYGVQAENGNFLFTMSPAHEVEAYTSQRLRGALEAQGYAVEVGEEEGEYVLAAYPKQA